MKNLREKKSSYVVTECASQSCPSPYRLEIHVFQEHIPFNFIFNSYKRINVIVCFFWNQVSSFRIHPSNQMELYRQNLEYTLEYYELL